MYRETIRSVFFHGGWLIPLLLLAGCAAQSEPTAPGYQWGNYSSTYYAYKYNPSEQTRRQHMRELESIIRTAHRKRREHEDACTCAPPGLYAEYGYFLMKEGKTERAIKFFRLEQRVYPESKALVRRLIRRAREKQPNK